MKREILCPTCTKTTSQAITGCRIEGSQIVDPYPGEHAKFRAGVLVRSCVCDSCGIELKPGENATALSIWADYGGVPYYPWEAEYLD